MSKSKEVEAVTITDVSQSQECGECSPIVTMHTLSGIWTNKNLMGEVNIIWVRQLFQLPICHFVLSLYGRHKNESML